MDEGLYETLDASVDVVLALSRFYRSRVAWLLGRGLPVFRYELVVTEAKESSKAMCRALGLAFDKSTMDSHNHHPDKIGHGMNDLQRPIDQQSLDKWRILDLSVRRQVLESCNSVASQAGYRMHEDHIQLL